MASSADCTFGNVAPIRLSKRTMESSTNVGMRQSQEDRVVVCPRMIANNEVASLCAVFDGTVGFEAAEYCQQNIAHNLRLDKVNFLNDLLAKESVEENELIERKAIIEQSLRTGFLETDAQFIRMAGDRGGLDYTSSTGVVALFWHQMVSIAHIGDSRACLCRIPENSDQLACQWITVDHKPDQPREHKRIQEAGGSLVYLHGNKPFIRGADFVERQAKGMHPKQLNYSRAFGGKDLKPYGLSADPSVSHRALSREDKFILIGSDGLWDTLPLKTICDIAWKSHLELKANPAKGAGVQVVANEIINAALNHMPMTTVRDNISVVVIFFHWDNEHMGIATDRKTGSPKNRARDLPRPPVAKSLSPKTTDHPAATPNETVNENMVSHSSPQTAEPVGNSPSGAVCEGEPNVIDAAKSEAL